MSNLWFKSWQPWFVMAVLFACMVAIGVTTGAAWPWAVPFVMLAIGTFGLCCLAMWVSMGDPDFWKKTNASPKS